MEVTGTWNWTCENLMMVPFLGVEVCLNSLLSQ